MTAVALTVDNGNWVITVWSLPFPNPKAHPGKALLNLKVAPKEGYDPEKDSVAPHGLIGQSYDGDGEGIDGATDDYSGAEMTTKAMAEGAIEGEASEYKMTHKFSTRFKYSRFGQSAAAPRDTSKLTGKRVRGKAAHASASPDVVPSADEVLVA